MKQVQIISPKPSKSVNWDKKQWVINDDNDILVLTTGEHLDRTFSGILIPQRHYPNGEYSGEWSKLKFRTLDFDIPFIISND